MKEFTILVDPKNSSKNLLVIQPLPGIGDTIWHIPHMKALAATSQTNQITLLTKERSLAKQLLSETNFVREVLYLSPEKRGYFGLFGSFRLGNYLAPFGFDQAWILHGSARYSIATWWAGIPTRVGYGIRWQDAFLTSPYTLSRDEKSLSAIAKATRLLDLNNVPIRDKKPTLSIATSTLQSAASFLGSSRKFSVALAIGSSEPTKQWGQKNYINLLEKLRDKLDPIVILIGGKTDADMANSISEHFDQASWLKQAIDLPILRAAAIAGSCNICIGNDTGILNIAASVGTPCIGIFCGSAPQSQDPLIRQIQPEEQKHDLDDEPSQMVANLVFESVQSFAKFQ